MPGFWDASAIVPLCVPVENPRQSRRFLREHSPVVWWSTGIEVASALGRLRRERVLLEEHHRACCRRLAVLRKIWREIQPTNRLRDIAETCLERHELRAADAFQLAAALVWCNEKPKNRAFLCRDIRLLQAARQEGFAIIELLRH
jgi:predicted nucleic acid-binding protein